jgi:hypothetical protein
MARVVDHAELRLRVSEAVCSACIGSTIVSTAPWTTVTAYATEPMPKVPTGPVSEAEVGVALSPNDNLFAAAIDLREQTDQIVRSVRHSDRP